MPVAVGALGRAGRCGLISPSFFSAAETFAKRALSAAAARKSSSLALIVA